MLNLPPRRALWMVAWPAIALGLLRSGFYLVNSFWVGRLGAEALEGQAGASFATWIIYIWGEMGSVGLLALTARAVGAGERRRLPALVAQGIWLALALGAIMAALSGPAPAQYFRLLGYTGDGFAEALAAGTSYMRVLMLGSPTLMVALAIQAVFRAIGDTRTALIITTGSLLLNACLDPVLIFGFGPVPALGVSGAAAGSVISDGAGIAAGLFLLRRHGAFPKWAAPDPRAWLRIVRISLPMAVAGFGFCLVYVFLGPIVTAFGPGAMAALGLGHRIESVAYLFASGVGVATAALVGQNLGARSPERARRTVDAAERLNLVVLCPFSAVLYLGAFALFGLFTADASIREAGVAYLHWNALVLVLMAMEILYEEAYAGAGQTLPPLLVSMPLTLARIPLAWFLSSQTPLGLNGVWIAIALSTFAKGLILRCVFRRGGWARRLGADL